LQSPQIVAASIALQIPEIVQLRNDFIIGKAWHPLLNLGKAHSAQKPQLPNKKRNQIARAARPRS